MVHTTCLCGSDRTLLLYCSCFNWTYSNLMGSTKFKHLISSWLQNHNYRVLLLSLLWANNHPLIRDKKLQLKHSWLKLWQTVPVRNKAIYTCIYIVVASIRFTLRPKVLTCVLTWSRWNRLWWQQTPWNPPTKGRGAFLGRQFKQHDTKNSDQSLRLLTKASGCRNPTCCQLQQAIAQI